MTLVWCPVSSCHNSRARVEEKVLTTAAKEAAEKVENSVARMTLNASKFRKNAHIEFKRDGFSSASETPHFSAASSAGGAAELAPIHYFLICSGRCLVNQF